MTHATTLDRDTASKPLPMAALVVMALTGFIVISTETMPAGLLLGIASDLRTTPGVAGQLVASYALGTVLAAIPATTLTRGWRRKPVLLIGIAGFLVANTATAVAPGIVVALVARFVAGAFSGLLWGMLAGYARRISAPEHAGRALAIAMTGTPVALAVGTPLGAWLGGITDWRLVFIAMSVLSAIAAVLTALVVPDAPGQEAGSRLSLGRVVRVPGVALILAVVFVWMFAHNLEYTYIAEYVQAVGSTLGTGAVLVVFGVASLVGVWLTGAVIDRRRRVLTLTSIAAFLIAAGLLPISGGSPVVMIIAVSLWGLGFGGAATQLQTAMAIASGENADVANSALTVAFNLAIFAAAGIGAVVVDQHATLVLPALMGGATVLALALVGTVGRRAF